MVFPAPNGVRLCYPPPRLPRLPCQASFMPRENSKTRRALWRVDGKAEDVCRRKSRDDNAASGVPERPTGMSPLVS